MMLVRQHPLVPVAKLGYIAPLLLDLQALRYHPAQTDIQTVELNT
jgi:hypothetical protein